MTSDPVALGTQRNRWLANATHVDMVNPRSAPRPLGIASTPQAVTIDLARTALIIIDMQNDFCAADGVVDFAGGDYAADRVPIDPLNRLTPALRAHGVPIVWLNWGNRPDLANMPPNQVHLFKPTGTGVGLGEPLPNNGSHVLQKDSWGAAVVDELKVADVDLRVDKHRISGFWDTPLDSILRNLDVQTLLFAGVNIDQCVMCTLTDANFLGYGCVLIEDCCATSSPAFCTEATLWNVRKCFGFVANSGDVIRGLEAICPA
jgi:nicotinamidase-related amidase